MESKSKTNKAQKQSAAAPVQEEETKVVQISHISKLEEAGEGPYEMNIRVGSVEQIKANIAFGDLLRDAVVIKQMQQMALASINDGYTHIVYNFIKNGGQLSEKDNCTFQGFDLQRLWNECEQRGLPKYEGLVCPNFSQIKQFTRLTIICDDPKVVHQIINLSSGEKKQYSIVNSYDLLAVRTSESEQIFDQCCTKSDVDIISIDMSARLNFFLSKPLVKQALQRGAQFEICYGSACFEGSHSNRKQFLQNCMQLIKVTKGHGIIFSSEVNNSIYQRSPVDCTQLGVMMGMNLKEALNVVSKNCLMAFKHAHMRKTYKGVAELVFRPLLTFSEDEQEDKEEEEEKMTD